MIPKTIHYCWFGKSNPPEIVKKCIKSWKEYCPEFEIKLWNEDNYDVTKNRYMKEAYDNKKWAFVSDYARLDIIYNEGGIYLDTDVELIKPLDDLLNFRCFFAGDGCGINTGVGFGAEEKNDIVKMLLDEYEGVSFIKDGNMDLTPCTVPNTRIFLKNGYNPTDEGIQNILGATIFPSEYFSPTNGMSELNATDKTYGIHHGSRLWETGLTRLKSRVRLTLGRKWTNRIKKVLKFFGLKK